MLAGTGRQGYHIPNLFRGFGGSMRSSLIQKRSFRVFPLLLVLVVSAGVPGPAGAAAHDAPAPDNAPLENRSLPPKIIETEEYYGITGSCEADLCSQMRQDGAARENGRTFYAATDWKLSRTYSHIWTANACATQDFLLTAVIRVRYPRWTPGADAPGPLKEKWEAYQRSLRDHESLHRYQVARAAEDISAAVARLAPAPTCSDLDRRIDRLFREKTKELEEDQRRYDAVSRHGAAQGAVFP